MAKFKVLVTGATGFIGQALCHRFLNHGHEVFGGVRNALDVEFPIQGVQYCSIALNNSLGQFSQLEATRNIEKPYNDGLSGKPFDFLIHCAGRAHILNETSSDPLKAFQETNVTLTMDLAEKALKLGVKRFIFISSVGVMGPTKGCGEPFTNDDSPKPTEDYAVSKLQAENLLLGLSQKTGMEVVVIRPPLVYGPNVGGNFYRLLKWVDRGVPIPIAMKNSKRSFIGIDNLLSIIEQSLTLPGLNRKCWLVSDGSDVSIRETVGLLASVMSRNVTYLPMPVWLLRLAGSVLGRQKDIGRLIDCLEIDPISTENNFETKDFKPLEQGLREMALWYSKSKKGRTHDE